VGGGVRATRGRAGMAARLAVLAGLACLVTCAATRVRADAGMPSQSDARIADSIYVAIARRAVVEFGGSTAWRQRPARPVAWRGDSLLWRPLAIARAAPPLPDPFAPGGRRLWNAPARDTLRWAFALVRWMRALAPDPGSAIADSCRAALAATPNPWQWECAAALARSALHRADTLSAERWLDAAAGVSAPADRAERAALDARLRAARGDTAAARREARQILRVAPTLAPARDAVALLDALAAAGGDSLSVDDTRAAAEVENWLGDRPAAIRRLTRAFTAPRYAAGWASGLRLGEWQRSSRRFPDAESALGAALRVAPDSAARAKVWLERARVRRDAGDYRAAERAYAVAASLTRDVSVAEAAWWEAGREAEEQLEWKKAQAAYARVDRLGGRRAPDARFRDGLVRLLHGDRRGARRAFARSNGEGARFWWAIAVRDSSRAAADTALTALARMPGYAFYRTAARESLGFAGERAGAGVVAAPPDDEPALRVAEDALAAGLEDDAAFLVERWAADDPRLTSSSPARGRPWALLHASAIEHACGRPGNATRFAERAAVALADSADSVRWIASAALYAPPFADDFARVEADGRIRVPADLMRALAWKESHFDSAARSRAGAIGLTQLLPGVAQQMASRLGEPEPADSSLRTVAANLRYGGRYLRALLDRFAGRVPLALAAYNAGPDAATRWATAAGREGDALLVEFIAYPETQDYVKTIVAVRAAYRELRPRAARE